MNKDAYNEIINGQDTYESIALALSGGKSVMIGWTDGLGSHYDILLHYKWIVFDGGQIQGGLRPKTDLFVSVMRVGAFGFEVENGDTFAGYFAEKLDRTGIHLQGATGEKFAELINGIKRELIKI